MRLVHTAKPLRASAAVAVPIDDPVAVTVSMLCGSFAGVLDRVRKTDVVALSEDLTTILFDFHATLARSRGRGAWIRAAREHAGRPTMRDADAADGGPQRLLNGLSQVWVLARHRDPLSSWDLNAADHREAFTTVLTKDVGCAEWLATALYDVMPDQWVLYDDVIDVLTSLRRAGKHLGVVSNIGIDIRPRLDALGVLPLFSSVVLSFEVGVTKPDPAIFTKALRDLGSSASRTLMVGDTWDQDGAAAAVGMSTLILPVKDRPSKGLRAVLDICRI